MTEHPFENEASQAEKRRVMKDTMHSRAQAALDEDRGGRFALASKKPIGAPVAYPQLPESSPWSNDPVGDERPLGFEIDAMEPVGTEAEITRSIAGTPLTAPTESSPAVETGGVPAPSLRRRA